MAVWSYHAKPRLFGAQPGFTIGRMLHPSPASPLANRDFAGTAKRQLVELGLWEALQEADPG